MSCHVMVERWWWRHAAAEEVAEEEEERRRVGNEKQEPHTEMWGIQKNDYGSLRPYLKELRFAAGLKHQLQKQHIDVRQGPYVSCGVA